MKKVLNNKDLLIYILERTDIKTFNIAIKTYNLQLLYESKRNSYVTDLFEGKVLKYAVRMAEVFNEVQNSEQSFLSKDLESRINQLKFSIKYDRRKSQLIQEHNILVGKFKEINIGVNNMIKLYRKIYKSKITK